MSFEQQNSAKIPESLMHILSLEGVGESIQTIELCDLPEDSSLYFQTETGNIYLIKHSELNLDGVYTDAKTRTIRVDIHNPLSKKEGLVMFSVKGQAGERRVLSDDDVEFMGITVGVPARFGPGKDKESKDRLVFR